MGALDSAHYCGQVYHGVSNLSHVFDLSGNLARRTCFWNQFSAARLSSSHVELREAKNSNSHSAGLPGKTKTSCTKPAPGPSRVTRSALPSTEVTRRGAEPMGRAAYWTTQKEFKVIGDSE